MVIRRLSDGRRLLRDPAITGPAGLESSQMVDSLALGHDGTMAWIATARSVVAHSTEIEVHRASQRGQERLDRGTAIDSKSLRLHGSKLTWKDGSVERSATLL